MKVLKGVLQTLFLFVSTAVLFYVLWTFLLIPVLKAVPELSFLAIQLPLSLFAAVTLSSSVVPWMFSTHLQEAKDLLTTAPEDREVLSEALLRFRLVKHAVCWALVLVGIGALKIFAQF